MRMCISCAILVDICDDVREVLFLSVVVQWFTSVLLHDDFLVEEKPE